MKITCTIFVLFGLSWMRMFTISEADHNDSDLRLRKSNGTFFTRNRFDALPEFSPRRILKEIDFNEFSNANGLLTYFREREIERQQMPSRRIQSKENFSSQTRARIERREIPDLKRYERTTERYHRELSRHFRRETEYRKLVERRRNLSINPSRNEKMRSERFHRNEKYERNLNLTDSFGGKLFQLIWSYMALIWFKINEICKCTFSLVTGMLIFDLMGQMIRIKPKEEGKGFKTFVQDVMTTGRFAPH